MGIWLENPAGEQRALQRPPRLHLQHPFGVDSFEEKALSPAADGVDALIDSALIHL